MTFLLYAGFCSFLVILISTLNYQLRLSLQAYLGMRFYKHSMTMPFPGNTSNRLRLLQAQTFVEKRGTESI